MKFLIDVTQLDRIDQNGDACIRTLLLTAFQEGCTVCDIRFKVESIERMDDDGREPDDQRAILRRVGQGN
jgi:hypothetical protein